MMLNKNTGVVEPDEWYEEEMFSNTEKVTSLLYEIVPLGTRVRIRKLDVHDEDTGVAHYYADHVNQVGTVTDVFDGTFTLLMDFNQKDFLVTPTTDRWEIVDAKG